MTMNNSTQANGPSRELACGAEVDACLRRVRSWPAPPNWCLADWFQETAAIAAGAAWEAQRQFDPSRGVAMDAFVRSRVLARTLTRYRQEWGFGIRCISEMGESEDGKAELNGDLFASIGQHKPMFDAVLEAVIELSERSRWLIEQLFWGGRTEVEIARDLGISQQAIAKRKRVVLGVLRQRLTQDS